MEKGDTLVDIRDIDYNVVGTDQVMLKVKI
jgi:hypothetical protein